MLTRPGLSGPDNGGGLFSTRDNNVLMTTEIP